jgi:transcriptional regulatory protein RtcR
MAVLAERGRVTLAMVEDEVGVLKAQWQAVDADPDGTLLSEVLTVTTSLDAFDRVQLAAVIRTCRQTSGLSAAGRALFAVSRRESQPERCRPVAQIPCALRA